MEAVSVRDLALWLSWPSVLGEFCPAPLVGRSEDRSPAAPWPEGDRRVVNVREAFRASVRSCMADHETIAVSLSGGMDSLAVLIEAARIAADEGCRVVAVAADLVDDGGHPSVPTIRRLLEAAGLSRVELLASSIDDLPSGLPSWRPQGPELDALPLINRRLAEQAADRHATVVLGGNGADESLGAVRYLLGTFARATHWLGARAYWADSIGTSREAYTAEALAALAPLMPKRLRTFVYFALEWPELCTRPEAPDILTDALREHVSTWSTQWITDMIRFHASHHRSWARAAAWDALYPLTILTGPGPIPLRHPFLTEPFLEAVRQLPIARRYDPTLPHAYWRQKAQVVGLLPPQVRAALPTAKATFRTTLAGHYADQKSAAAHLIELGVLSRARWHAEHDPLLVSRVNALEDWVSEAVDRGHPIC